MADLKARLDKEQINPLMAMNEIQQLNPDLNIIYENGSDSEREEAKVKTQFYDAYGTVFFSVLIFCKKIVIEDNKTSEQIEFEPAVDRSEKDAKSRAASLCLKRLFQLQSTGYMYCAL